MGSIVAHSCCLPWVYGAPSSLWLPALSAHPPAGGWSSSLRAHRAVRPPLVLLMGLTTAPHPQHLDLLRLRYGYRPLHWKWRVGQGLIVDLVYAYRHECDANTQSNRETHKYTPTLTTVQSSKLIVRHTHTALSIWLKWKVARLTNDCLVSVFVCFQSVYMRNTL